MATRSMSMRQPRGLSRFGGRRRGRIHFKERSVCSADDKRLAALRGQGHAVSFDWTLSCRFVFLRERPNRDM